MLKKNPAAKHITTPPPKKNQKKIKNKQTSKKQQQHKIFGHAINNVHLGAWLSHNATLKQKKISMTRTYYELESILLP